MTIIGIHGFARVGKDTLGSALTSSHGFTRFACADPLRDQLLTLDPRVNGTMTLGGLLDELGGSWEKARNHRVYGAEVRALVDTYTNEVLPDIASDYVTMSQVRRNLTLLDPFLDGDVTLDSLLRSVDYDWDAAKSSRLHRAEVRRIMQVYGTEVCRAAFGGTVWVDILARNVQESGAENVVVTDVRFAEEAEWVISQGGYIVEVVRPGVGSANNHASDQRLPEHLISETFHNDGGMGKVAAYAAHLANMSPVSAMAA